MPWLTVPKTSAWAWGGNAQRERKKRIDDKPELVG
jgi:hypothetical protein